jgi:hypothetical protein
MGIFDYADLGGTKSACVFYISESLPNCAENTTNTVFVSTFKIIHKDAKFTLPYTPNSCDK